MRCIHKKAHSLNKIKSYIPTVIFSLSFFHVLDFPIFREKNDRLLTSDCSGIALLVIIVIVTFFLIKIQKLRLEAKWAKIFEKVLFLPKLEKEYFFALNLGEKVYNFENIFEIWVFLVFYLEKSNFKTNFFGSQSLKKICFYSYLNYFFYRNIHFVQKLC